MPAPGTKRTFANQLDVRFVPHSGRLVLRLVMSAKCQYRTSFRDPKHLAVRYQGWVVLPQWQTMRGSMRVES